MRSSVVGLLLIFVGATAIAQSAAPVETIAKVPYTAVKNQANSGTCWSFSACSMLESQALKLGLGEFDLSEMFVVRNIYVDKARNYLLRQGAAQFGPGGLGHDVINATAQYGIVPEGVYSGLLLGNQFHNHTKLDAALKSYLDSLLKTRPIPANWLTRYESILDEHLGKAPKTFTYRERVYTPITFAEQVLKFKKSDYVNITSFKHHPWYKDFALEIPDNYSSEHFYNIPLDEMLALVEEGLKKGYSMVWDTDVSNPDFRHKEGYALLFKDDKSRKGAIDPEVDEQDFDENIRQQLFENLITQDDHLLHIVGIEQSASGKKFFVVKNSWGESGPFKGIVKVSVPYFAVNTISLVVPKAAINEQLRKKLSLE